MLEYIELKDEKPTKLLTLTFDELYTDGELPIHAKGDGMGFGFRRACFVAKV